MAEVFRRVNGRKITEIIARTETAQRAVDDEAIYRAQIAAGLLENEPKVRTGTSQISLDKGKIDAYVVLDDTRGLQAALTIEYGRQAMALNPRTGQPQSGMEGLFILHRAFNLRRAKRPKRGGDDLRE